MRRLLALSFRYRRDCLTVFAFQVLLLLLGIGGLGLTGLAIDVIRHALDSRVPAPRLAFGFELPAANSSHTLLLYIGALVLVMAITRAVLLYGYSLALGKLMHLKLVPELRTRVFDKLQRLSFRFFDENASASIINRVTTDVQSVRSFVEGVLLQGAILLLSLSLYLLYMLRTHETLTFACLLLTPLIWLLTSRFSRWARPAYSKNRELVDQMVLAVSEGIKGIQVTKVFGREQVELSRFARKNAAILEQQAQIFRNVSRFGPTVRLITHLELGVLLLYGGYLVTQGALTLGQLIVFAGLLQQFSGQVSGMADIINTLQQSLSGARRVFEVLDAPLGVASPVDALRPTRVEGRVRFENVEFAYGGAKTVLHGVHFDVAPGRSLALFGATGAGKSTLLGLIPRFQDPTAGRVLVDDVDVRRLDLDVLRRSIGIVFQQSLLFRTSVAQNIAFGHPEATRELIEHAAKLAGAHGFIQELSHGYDTLLQEAANDLSGGQRQRIALARALLLEPSILLLDEPTTAVDPETEHEVWSAMQEAMRGRTTIVVASRLSTLQRVDTILVLEAGRIVESGSHAELLAARGVYFRAAGRQASLDEAPSSADVGARSA